MHVCNDTICEDQKNVELLVILSDCLWFDHLVELTNNWTEVRRAIQLHILQSFNIVCFNFLKTVDPGIEDISIEGKTVRCVIPRLNVGTKAVEADLFIRVVILEYVTHALDGFQILVSVVKVM